MTVYLLADPHLNHAGITAWTNRPELFEEVLSAACHRLLMPGDDLIIMGDLHLGPRAGLHEAVRRILPDGVRGTLILGNHDRHSKRAYHEAGLLVMDSVTHRNVLISHHGSRVLPDNARAQLVGHYHQNPLNPELPNALKISIEEYGLAPLAFDTAYTLLQRRRLLRDLPEPADDRWFLALPEYAQITVTLASGDVRHPIPGRALPVDPDTVIHARFSNTSARIVRRYLPEAATDDAGQVTLSGQDARLALSVTCRPFVPDA